MDERLRCVARLLDGEKMAPLCREFDISRKPGYKIFERYKEKQINEVKRERPSWGAPKRGKTVTQTAARERLPTVSYTILLRRWGQSIGKARQISVSGPRRL